MSIRDIYFVLSEMAVGNVQARNLEEITLPVEATDCPVRLLTPATTGDQGFIAIGSLSKTAWAIRDLCLWQPVTAGGIDQYANEMLGYIELYAAGIRLMRNPTAGSVMHSVTFKVALVPWGGTDYWAIDVTVEVEEFLT